MFKILPNKQVLENEVSNLPKYEDGTVEEDRFIYVTRTEIEDKDFDLDDIEKQEHIKPITRMGKLEAKHVPSDKYVLEQHEKAFMSVLDKLPDSTEGKVNNYKTKAVMKLFPDGSDEEDIGLWVVNSVNSRAAVRINFVQRKEFGDVHIPKNVLQKHVSGYKRVHRGEWEKEFEGFLDTINAVRETWRVIVDDLSNMEADEDDIEAIKEIIGKKAAKRMDDWLSQRKVDDYTGKNGGWEPSVWDLILHGIKFVHQRLDSSSRVASDVTKEEKIRKLSGSLHAYALQV